MQDQIFIVRKYFLTEDKNTYLFCVKLKLFKRFCERIFLNGGGVIVLLKACCNTNKELIIVNIFE